MNTIIVFIKAPLPGKVKTRLCPPLSGEQAAKLYAAFARDTLEFAERVPGATVEVAYEPGGEFTSLDWLRARPPVRHFPQRGLDLGERLDHAFERAFSGGAEKAVAIGSDTPHLGPGLIETAFLLLDREDVALGPAMDGGYYLIGLKQSRPEIFRGISWSTAEVFQETMERAQRLRLQAAALPAFADVDTFADLTRLARRLRSSAAGACSATRHALKYIPRDAIHDETPAI